MRSDESPAIPGSGAWITVYVQLLNEGTLVYRPTRATIVGPGVVRLEATPDYDPENEEWEFPPGAIVRLEQRRFSEGEACIAARLIE
jgi:hypothetical protein